MAMTLDGRVLLRVTRSATKGSAGRAIRGDQGMRAITRPGSYIPDAEGFRIYASRDVGVVILSNEHLLTR